MSKEDAVAALIAIVGPAGCISDDADVAAFTLDYRKLYQGSAVAVILPASTEEVSHVLAWCSENRVKVVPQGGNTSLMRGSVPEKEGFSIILNLRRMRRVLVVDTVNDTMTLQAGVTLSAARAAAEEAGRLFPLRIGSEGSSQIGGNIATNAGGTAVLRYGNMRDLVLGIEAVLSDGRVFSSLRGLCKDNTGYDLKQLFVGAEGTLGVITAAVLKLFPHQPISATAFVAVQSPAAAIRLLTMAKSIVGSNITAFELISGEAIDLVREYLGNPVVPLGGDHEWMVLAEFTSNGCADELNAAMLRVLEIGMQAGDVLDAVIAQSMSDASTFWRLREEISDAQTKAGGSIKCDVSVPLSHIAKFIDDASSVVRALEPRSRLIVYGHIGDGNVHFNPLRPLDQEACEYLDACYASVSRAVDDLAFRLNGSVSAEHGIGTAKRDDLVRYKSTVEIEMMWQIKNALDPLNLLNPGKVLPPRSESMTSSG